MMENSNNVWMVFADSDEKYRISAGRKVFHHHKAGEMPGEWRLTTLIRPGDVISHLEGVKDIDKQFRVIGILSDAALALYGSCHT
jgi:hypothetical protein